MVSTTNDLETLVVVGVSGWERLLFSVELSLTVLSAFDKGVCAVEESEVHLYK